MIERLVGVSANAGGDGAGVGAPDLAVVFGRLADALTILAKDGKLAAQQADAVARLRGGAPLDAPLPVADPTKRGAGFDVFLDFAADDIGAADMLWAHLTRAGVSVARLDSDQYRETGPKTSSARWPTATRSS